MKEINNQNGVNSYEYHLSRAIYRSIPQILRYKSKFESYNEYSDDLSRIGVGKGTIKKTIVVMGTSKNNEPIWVNHFNDLKATLRKNLKIVTYTDLIDKLDVTILNLESEVKHYYFYTKKANNKINIDSLELQPKKQTKIQGCKLLIANHQRKKVMSILKNALIKVTGNHFIQNILEKNILVSQYLMGIGTGGGVSSSGEHAIFHILEKRIKPPYCIFDVGSNKGQFLQLILKSISVNEFSVHCFEPGHETFAILAESSKEDMRIKLNNIGIGKEKGEAVLHYDSAGSGLASLTKRKLDHFNIDFNKEEKVEINTIDSYCSENSIDHIHLLKIDIEGHELDALAGAKEMFFSNSIDIVTFEFGGCNIDTRTFFQDFWYFFDKANFTIFRITPSGYLHPIKSYKEIHEQFRTINFIALSNGYQNSATDDNFAALHIASGELDR